LETRRPDLLLAPGLAVLAVLLLLPLLGITAESFRYFEPGRIGALRDAPFTPSNKSV